MTNEQIVFNTAFQALGNKTLAELVTAQSKHESGNYSSNVFLRLHNSFGYKKVSGAKYQSTLPTTITAPEGGDYAYYADLADSVNDVCGWIKRRWTKFEGVTTPEQYAAALKASGYYGDTVANYTKGLLRWFKEFAIDKPVTVVNEVKNTIEKATGITITAPLLMLFLLRFL